MSYHIHPSENFTKEFRAVGSEQLKLAIAALTERPNGLLEAIHDARKCFKRLRSLYRLAATAAPAFRQAENSRIREMAKTLSAFRDASSGLLVRSSVAPSGEGQGEGQSQPGIS